MRYRATILPQQSLRRETAFRRITVELRRGRATITLQILDYAGAAQHANHAAVRVSGSTIVVVGAPPPSPDGTADEIASKIAAP